MKCDISSRSTLLLQLFIWGFYELPLFKELKTIMYFQMAVNWVHSDIAQYNVFMDIDKDIKG